MVTLGIGILRKVSVTINSPIIVPVHFLTKPSKTIVLETVILRKVFGTINSPIIVPVYFLIQPSNTIVLETAITEKFWDDYPRQTVNTERYQ